MAFRRLILVLVLVSTTVLTSEGQEFTFTTLAGPQGGAGWFDGQGTEARIVASDIEAGPDGSIYVAEAYNHTIRKVSPSGLATTLAGLAHSTGTQDAGGSSARFNEPVSLAVDGAGNVYVSDRMNHVIRKVAPSGEVMTLAGNPGQYGSADGVGRSARFYRPGAIAVAPDGIIYVSDDFNYTIRRITPSGEVSTLAGLARVPGTVDGHGSAARLFVINDMTLDGHGNLYATEGSNTIRKITPAGDVTTFAGTPGASGLVDGVGSAARFSYPTVITLGDDGNLWVMDSSNYVLRIVTPTGLVTTYTPSTGKHWDALVADGEGGFYATRTGVIVRFSAGVESALAGLSGGGGYADGESHDSRFSYPRDVAVDAGGNVFVADSLNATIRKISPDGVASTLAGQRGSVDSVDGLGSAARLAYPQGIAIDRDGNLYVPDGVFHTIRRITPTGEVTTIAGLAGSSGAIDGIGSAARFNKPTDVAVDGEGNVVVVDEASHTVRRITPEGAVTTIAGLAGVPGFSDGVGDQARFASPTSVAVDANGTILVRDNFGLRQINSAGVVTTIESLDSQRQLAFDADGNMFMTQTFPDHNLRKRTVAGQSSIVAGFVDSGGGDAEGTASAARFSYPDGLAVGLNGDIYVADSYNDKIRVGRPALAGKTTVTKPNGFIGLPHQLGFTGTATSFDWRVTRRPAGSVATLSSTTDASPTFAPDVTDTFEIQLTASDGVSTRIERVTLEPPRLKGSSSGQYEYAHSASVTFLLTGLNPGVVTARWATEDGSAVAGEDYVAASGSLTFAPGESYKSVAISILNDDLDEEDYESFRVVLFDVVGAQNGGGTTVSVVDDDPSPSISIDDISVMEGDIGTSAATFTVSLSKASGRVVSCRARTSGGTAKSGSDYIHRDEVLTFQPGETSKAFSVEIVGDYLAEDDETFFVTLSSVTNAAYGDWQGQGTIENEDISPSIAPSGLVAEATGTSSVGLSWQAFTGATYKVFRNDGGVTWAQIGAPTSSTFVDSTVSAGRSYLYKVRAIDGPVETIDSEPDLATTVLFTDSVLTQFVTTVKAAHVAELRSAVNAVRQLAGLGGVIFTDHGPGNGLAIKRLHVIELRAALDAARSALGLSSLIYTDPAIGVGDTTVKAAHIRELRDGVK